MPENRVPWWADSPATNSETGPGSIPPYDEDMRPESRPFDRAPYPPQERVPFGEERRPMFGSSAPTPPPAPPTPQQPATPLFPRSEALGSLGQSSGFFSDLDSRDQAGSSQPSYPSSSGYEPSVPSAPSSYGSGSYDSSTYVPQVPRSSTPASQFPPDLQEPSSFSSRPFSSQRPSSYEPQTPSVPSWDNQDPIAPEPPLEGTADPLGFDRSTQSSLPPRVNPMMGAEDPWAQVLSEQDPTPVPSVDDSQGNETRSYRTEVLQDLQDHSEYGSAFGEVGSDSQVYGDEARVTSGRQRKKGRRRGLKIVLISVLAVVLLSGGALTYAYIDLNSKLNQEDVGRVLGRNQPKAPVATSAVKYPGDPHAGRAVNILVLGTDSRSGDYSDGARSDTAMVVHVSADRTRVDVVSIPRDTLITIPANCPKEGGGTIAAAGWSNQGFNAAFAWGIYHGKSLATGIACSTLATEALSGLTIDKYVVVNFLGFVDVVDAIGGIDVELLCPIKAPNIGLDLSAGVHHIEGWTSVSLARARKGKGLGDQSDLHRIYRQQKIFDAVIDKVYAMNYFRDFSKLYNLAGAGISSVSTDLGDNLAEIAGFAYSLKNLNMNSLHFVMLPVGSAGNGTNVAVIQSQAKPIWDALRDDVPMPGTEVPVVAEDPGANPAPEDPGAGQAQAPVVDDEPKSTTNGPIVIQRPEDC